VFEEWVRPTRLYHFGLEGFRPGKTNRLHAGDDDGSDGDDSENALPAELAEGTAYEYAGLPFGLPRQIVAHGELWARRVDTRLASTDDEERLWAALVFGTSLYSELSEREMMTLAMRGGAVSPVTSYLAIEPGVRPSTEGLIENALGGLVGHGIASAYGSNCGGSLARGSFDPEKYLEKLLARARATCKLDASRVSARIETTRHEIVDVPAVTVAGGHDPSCLREAIWSWELPDNFTAEHQTYWAEVASPDGT
jgi:hypothetical protein